MQVQRHTHIPRTALYTVRTKQGLTYQIEALSPDEARRRATDPAIGRHIAILMKEALAQVAEVEPTRGPPRYSGLVFEDEFFNKR